MRLHERTIHRVIPAMVAELRRIAAEEGPEGAYLLNHADVTADYDHHKSGMILRLLFFDIVVWEKEVCVDEDMVRNMDNIEEKITAAMRGNLSLVAQMHFARLEKLFPRRIKDVRTSYDTEKAEKIIIVEFKNGHVAEATESEAKTDLFTARCAMLYDLPPR